eukprot:6017109-Pleurochrysis_carterae.AAC.2
MVSPSLREWAGQREVPTWVPTLRAVRFGRARVSVDCATCGWPATSRTLRRYSARVPLLLCGCWVAAPLPLPPRGLYPACDPRLASPTAQLCACWCHRGMVGG